MARTKRRADLVWLGAVCLCEMATMLVFLNYTAILPILQVEWGMGHGEAGLIFSAYQVCFGFLAAALSPAAVGLVLDRLQSASGGTAAISPWQWGPAFGILALGVLMGPVSMLALRRAQAQRHRQPPRSEESV